MSSRRESNVQLFSFRPSQTTTSKSLDANREDYSNPRARNQDAPSSFSKPSNLLELTPNQQRREPNTFNLHNIQRCRHSHHDSQRSNQLQISPRQPFSSLDFYGKGDEEFKRNDFGLLREKEINPRLKLTCEQ
ncbi:hypothetical protein Drorol1_Dr00010853 [Drosera rotundifolia]